MSYSEAIEAAGAKVLEFKEFGSYQGDWWAKIELNGKQGWVEGSYGSCSGCDAFEAEFSCGNYRDIGDDYVDESDERHPGHAEYLVRLKDFGAKYLEPFMSQAEAEAKAAENIEWDNDAEEMVAWIKANPLSN